SRYTAVKYGLLCRFRLPPSLSELRRAQSLDELAADKVRSSRWRLLLRLPLPRRALAAPSLHRHLRQNRHRDLFRRDRAEIEAGGGLDAAQRLWLGAPRRSVSRAARPLS